MTIKVGYKEKDESENDFQISAFYLKMFIYVSAILCATFQLSSAVAEFRASKYNLWKIINRINHCKVYKYESYQKCPSSMAIRTYTLV